MNVRRDLKVAVVGATGVVGETLRAILAERTFPVRELVALASGRSAGEEIHYAGKRVIVRDVAELSLIHI